MSTATQIQRIKAAKESIRASLQAKGISVDSGTPLDDYARYISTIPSIGTPISGTPIPEPAMSGLPSDSQQVLSNLWRVKNEIRLSIMDKGVDVSSASTIDDYSLAIDNIVEPYDVEPLAFYNVGTEPATLYLENKSGNTPNLEYSTDYVNWTTWDYSTQTIPVGKTLWVRGNNPNGFSKGTTDTRTSWSSFKGTGQLKVSGNLESLNDYTTETKTGKPFHWCFFELFGVNTNIVDASDLDLHLTTVNGARYYRNLFANCDNLVRAPKALPATGLTEAIYFNAFLECDNLEELPEILPATTLTVQCYSGMFARCPKLTKTPVLPATTLVSQCYQNMFLDSSAVTECTAYFTTEPSSAYTRGWLYQVANTGTLHQSSAATWTTKGEIYTVPSGWTIQGGTVLHQLKYKTSDNKKISVPTSGWGATIVSNEYVSSEGKCIITFNQAPASMPNRAFYSATTLNSIEITSGITSIGDEAFYNCTNLSGITLPSTLKTIGKYTFVYCNFASVNLPSGLTSIGQEAFQSAKITGITIPNTVTTIGSSGFTSCTSLKSVTMSNKANNRGKSLFYKCSGLTSVTYPEGITGITESEFQECTSLASASFPSTLKSVATYGLYKCSVLKTITCLATTAPTLGSNSLYLTASNGKLRVPSGSNYSTWKSALGYGTWTYEYI